MDAPADRYLALPDETVESLTRKLELERRVQYGAEKMLDVIEQKGASDGEDNEQVRERIIAQLEQANAQIKVLEAQLGRLAGASPQKRKRPQPRLKGYASTSSLRLSSSYTSSHLSQTSSRPRATRADSSATSDRWHGSSASGHGTPSRQRNGGDGNGNGDQSPGLWSSSSAHGQGGQGMTRETSGTGSGYAQAYPSGSMWGQASEQPQARISEADSELLGTISAAIYRLRTLGREVSRQMKGKGKGKGKENEQGAEKASQLGEEPWRCLTQAADLLKRAPVLKDLLDIDQVIQGALPFLSDWSTPRHRAAAYRLLRSVVNRARWGRMLDSGLEWLLIRTMSRDTKAVVEREQALLLLRAIATLPRPRLSTDLNASQGSLSRLNLLAYKVPLTDGLIRAIVAIAENSQDAMWIVCMETLVEIGILDIERLVQSDALRIVLLSFVNGPSELGPAVTGMLLYLANAPQDRQYLIAGSDVEMALTGLTEGYGQISARQASVYKEKLQNSVKCINLLLGSWSGLIYLCMDQYRAVKSLVSSLLVPVADMRDAVLDLVISSLHIKTPSFTQAFLDGKRLTVYNRTQEAASEALHEQIIPEHVEPSLTLVDQYIALILAIFLECNLLENLVTLIEENVAASRKATLLLGEILRMGNRLLPSRYAAQLQALPKLFNGATAFNDANERHFALSALTSINSLERNQAHTHRHFYGAASSRPKPSRLRASSLTASATGAEAEPPVKARGIRGVRDRMGISVEDKLFQQMIVDSGVLLGRDHTKWNFDLILDLIEGPLHTPKRMDEAIRATKFIRRLIGFLQPHNNRFSSIKRTRPNHKWVQLACGLIGTMLATPEGLKYLGEDKLLKQLSECFVELESKPFKSSAYLSAERVEGSLMYGYFELIGVLTSDEEGVKLLEQNRLFNSFYHLFDLGQRDDIVRLLIECFDYTIDSHTRILFTQALTASQPTTRLFATHHLGRALQDSDEWPIESSIQAWALQLLISQLYDPSDEVCEVAIMYLEEICADSRRLQMVVDHQPSISHLDDSGHTLFMRFLSTSTGFLYLREAGCVDQELDIWLSERNLLYVIEVEIFVTSVLRPFTSDTADDTWDIDGMTPTHFFGELTKTPEGCMYLRERGLVAEFAEIVRLHGLESEDQAVLTNVKSMLWVLGHIGSTKGGLPFLENEEIIEVIVEIAEQSPILTMKGVCFFVLGLISTTVMGAEILEEMGWTTSRTALGTTNGICLPTDISRFAYIQPWVRESALPDRPALPKLTGLEAEIMLYITNLSNYVLATKASQHLKRIRSRHPKYFASLTLFHRALRMISTNHYLPPVRGFILDLFDVPLTPETLGRLRRLEMAVEGGQSRKSQGGLGEGGGMTGRMGTRNPSPLRMSADPAEVGVGTRTSRSRTDSRARLDRERNGDGGREAVGDPTTPVRAQSDDKVPSRHSERHKDRYRDGESESAGSPRRNAQVESAIEPSGATAIDIDPYEYRRRAASSPGPASSSPVRSYSDGDGLGGRSDYNRMRSSDARGPRTGGVQRHGARLRGLTISTIPLGSDGMFS